MDNTQVTTVFDESTGRMVIHIPPPITQPEIITRQDLEVNLNQLKSKLGELNLAIEDAKKNYSNAQNLLERYTNERDDIQHFIDSVQSHITMINESEKNYAEANPTSQLAQILAEESFSKNGNDGVQDNGQESPEDII